ncbi:MAG: carboxymuconolactone decarboxylase family protein [Actinomycetota bacterium]|nr:carboxymuconolactone decarboxylase family protein [Actinomycetota bacterium]
MNNETLTRHRTPARAVLIVLGGTQFVNGIWATIAPLSFFEDFPFGRGWVEVLPAYNEHLMRDVGGLFLATGFLLLAAAVRLERRWVAISLISYLLFAIPHAVFHFFHLEPYGTGDAVANALTLAATVLLPLWLLALLARGDASPRKAADPSGEMRIQGVPDSSRSLLARISFFESRRRFGQVMDPLRVYAHHPLVMTGYALHEMAAERATLVPARLKALAEMRAAMLPGCEWCCDFGSSLANANDITEEDMQALSLYASNGHFSELETLVLDYATGISRTPVDVTDEQFARLREHFDEAQLVELTDIIALENYRARFNWAFGIGSQGFAEGAHCVRPEGV